MVRIVDFGLIFIIGTITLVNAPDPTCRPGDKTCSPFFGAPQDIPIAKVLTLDEVSTKNKKYILLSDSYENSPSEDIEFRIFQQRVLNFTELGAAKVLDSLTSSKVASWAIRMDPVSPWILLQEALQNSSKANGVILGEFSSVRIENIGNAGLAQLNLYSTKEGIESQTVILLKFVMPLPLVARLQVKVETNKIFSTVKNDDFSNLPFIIVQDIFNVTLAAQPSIDILQEANRTFSSLPSSKTLQKKISEFTSTAQAVAPENFNPGIYLKPKSNYGLFATLEFSMFGESGNSTKILYEQGDVYLHRRDKLRFIPKIPPKTSPLSVPATLEFFVRCWDGTTQTETALGPIHELKINFDSLFGGLPQLKSSVKWSSDGQLPPVIPSVPYNLTETQYENGFSVGDLVEWFYTSDSVNIQTAPGIADWAPWAMGMALVACGTGQQGTWQYRNGEGSWQDSPSTLKTGWKIFRNDQQGKRGNNGTFATTFTLVDLKEMEQIQVLLLSPKSTIRFKPSNDQSFWSSTDAFNQNGLSFYAWKPKNVSATSTGQLVDLDMPNCKACTDNGISKDGVSICAERYGCDGKLSSMMQMDSCDTCGGPNECLDCKRIPRGKAKWVCDVCTEDGTYLKDCRGVCNGTYQLTAKGDCIDPSTPRGCDGQYNSTAKLNDCGVCVLGTTGKLDNYSKDTCGVCNGTNACLGCDGLPNSGKLTDKCGLCRDPKDQSFNKDCTARVVDIHPKVASVVNGTSLINVTGLSSVSSVDCWLTLLTLFSNVNDPLTTTVSPSAQSNVSLRVSSVANVSSELKSFALQWDHVDTPGVYNLTCRVDHKFPVAMWDNQSTLYLVDYNILQVTSVEPNAISLGDTPNMTVKVTGVFIPAITQDAHCLGKDRRSNGSYIFPADIKNSQVAYCDLNSITTPMNLDIRVVPQWDCTADMLQYQSPLNLTVKAKAPKIISAKFSDSTTDVVISFDTNVTGNGNCQQILDDIVLAKLGTESSCRFNGKELRIVLGSNHQINVNDQIQFKSSSVHTASVEFFDFVPSDIKVNVSAPNNPPIPVISMDSPVTVSTCANETRLIVRKAIGNAGRTMLFEWTAVKMEAISTNTSTPIPSDLLQLTQSTKADTLVIPMTLLTEQNAYTFNIVACNFMNQCSIPNQVRLNVGNGTDNQLNVQILGLDPPVRCGSKRHLKASVSLKSCENVRPLASNLVFQWNVVARNDTVIASANDWIFILPTFGFEPGEKARVRVQAWYNEGPERNFTSDTSLTVTFEPYPLWVRLGALTRAQGVQDQLVLDGSESYDPNKQTQELHHNWTCYRTDPSLQSSNCYTKSNSTLSTVFERQFDISQPMLIVPANTFDPGVYNFMDTVTSGSMQANGTVAVTLVPGVAPVIQMVPLSVQKPSNDQPITFRANVYSEQNITVSLEFVDGEGYSAVDLPEQLQRFAMVQVPASAIGPNGYVFSFTLPPAESSQYPNWAGLTEATSYAIRIIANTTDGLAGESFLSFHTNQPPSMGTLTMTPVPADSPIYALSTLVRLEATGFTDHTDDLPLSYQFGVRTQLGNGSEKEDWFPTRTDVDEFNLYLASADSSELHPDSSCNRIGYQTMVRVCDVQGACIIAVAPSQPFQVRRPNTLTTALDDMTQEIGTDLADGNGFGASMKMGTVIEECCGYLDEKSDGTSQAVASHILDRLAPRSDKDDLVDAARITNGLLLRPNATVTHSLLSKLKEATQDLASSMGMVNTVPIRRKRDVHSAGTSSHVDHESVTQLLGAYEIVVTHSNDPDAVSVYLKGTQDLLGQMCSGRDAAEPAMMVSSKGSSPPLCVIEAQGLFMDSSIVNKNISTAGTGSSSAAQVHISTGLQETYTLWPCNGGRSTCTTVCLATAVYFVTTSTGITPLGDYWTKNVSTSMLSHAHTVELVDPMSKEFMSIKRPDWERYSILIPLIKQGNTGYYACKIFITTSQEWSSDSCDVTGTKMGSDNIKYISCQCGAFGDIAVFESEPPSPPVIGPHQPVQVSLVLDKSDTSTGNNQKNATLEMLSAVMKTSTRRIVELDITKPGSDLMLAFQLRPPNRFDWTDSSELLMRLNDSSSIDQSTIKGGPMGRIVPQSLVYSPVKKDWKNDLNNRMITMKILNDYDTTVTSAGASALISTFTTQLANATGISLSRITDMTFAKGSTVITFVIQSVQPKSTEISAEMAAWILLDQIHYEELALVDVNGIALIIDSNRTKVQEVERKPTQAPNDTLPIIIGGTVGSVFFIVIIFVIVLVAIKHKGRRDKVSPFSTPQNGSPNDSQRNSATTSVSVRRISITEEQNQSSLRSRRR